MSAAAVAAEGEEADEEEEEVGSEETAPDENDVVDEGLERLRLDPELLALEEEYNAIAAALPLEAAKAAACAADGGEPDAPQQTHDEESEGARGEGETEELRAAGGMGSVYGEMGWWAMVGILDSISRHGGLPAEPGDFVDIGAGSGKALAAAGLLRSKAAAAAAGAGAAADGAWVRLRGVEYSPPLHQASLAVASAWAAAGRAPALELHLGDASDYSLEGATLVMAHSTAFGDALTEAIALAAERELPIGAWVVTVTRPLPRAAARGWDIVEARRRTVSWGAATVFLHRRRTADAVLSCTLCDVPCGAAEVSAERYRSQVWFHCRSCGLEGTSGVCAPCAAACHGRCAGVEFAAHSPFFCDCGAAAAVGSWRAWSSSEGCRGCSLAR